MRYGTAVYAGLTLDAAGNLYGAATAGGTGGGGTVFSLTPSGDNWTIHLLFSIWNQDGGGGPAYRLATDQAGNLYGIYFGGLGSNNTFVVFKLTPQQDGTWGYSVVQRLSLFPGADQCALIVDASENIYGVISEGGRYGWGAVYKIAQ